jgi:hypothetical protein
MKRLPALYRRGPYYFAIACYLVFTALLPARGQSSGDFSAVHFDGTFVHLGPHVLDTSDLGVLLERTNPDFQNLSKSNEKDLSWDSDGVRYTEAAKGLKMTWVVDPNFLHSMGGHPTHPFRGKLSIFEIEIVRNEPISKVLLSKDGFAATGNHPPISYRLEKNGWKVNIITDQNRDPQAVTLEHPLSPD